MIRAAAAIAAAGSGTRMGGVQKQYAELAGEPVLLRAIRPFLEHSEITHVVVALPPADVASPPSWLVGVDPRIVVAAGGATRTDSVRAALKAIPADVEVVLIHDAARPLVTRAVIERCIRVAATGLGAVAAWPLTDTVKAVDASRRIVGTPDREHLWSAQTPQAFPRAMIVEALRAAARSGYVATDDAALVERYGGTVQVVEGSPDNIKITCPEDLRIAEALLALRGSSAP
ncbi:MAG: 2-C-methyl-D-erythritol 4-phosphate cytidylyltransferase [Gemmatimonadetes bacterium]|nr:2-C-methyl-D-erythritol 4-phosphate cytidylyltransferase [Gemmatimonadota bacterium]